MLDAGALKRSQEEKRQHKKNLVSEMQQKQDQMRPFVIFVGVKDNPIPYEKKYR